MLGNIEKKLAHSPTAEDAGLLQDIKVPYAVPAGAITWVRQRNLERKTAK